MANPALRVVVVGTGFGARIHVPGLRASGRFEVVALVGRDPERTRRVAERVGVSRWYGSLEAALADVETDAVSIASPPAAHADQARLALGRGKHVLCEKPMAATLEEARAMHDAAEAAGTVALVGHEFRFHPARAGLGELVRAGALGEPRLLVSVDELSLYVMPYRAAPDWWFDEAAGGGWLGASGSHLIDCVHTWLGRIRSLCGSVVRLSARGDADDSFTLLAETESGARAVLQQSAAFLGPRAGLMRFAGSEATAWIDDDWQLWLARPGAEPERVSTPARLALPVIEIPSGSGPFAARELPSFVRQAERFADAIAGRPAAEPAAATFADGLRCQEVMEAARRSTRQRRWIDL